MNSLKRLSALAISFIVIGAILAGVGFGNGGRLLNNRFGYYIGNGIFFGLNFGDADDKDSKLTNSYTYSRITSLDISMGIGDIEVKYTDDDVFQIDCMNIPEKYISQNQDKEELEFEVDVDSVFSNPGPSHKIIVRIPKNAVLQNVQISSDVGKIEADEIKATRIQIEADTGSVKIGNLVGSVIQLSVDTGAQHVKKVKCGSLELSNDLGSMTVDEADCKKLKAENDTGTVSVGGVLATDINLDNDVGKIKCDILGKETDYDYEVDTDIGQVNIGEKIFGFDTQKKQKTNLPGFVKVTNDVGSVEVHFQ